MIVMEGGYAIEEIGFNVVGFLEGSSVHEGTGSGLQPESNVGGGSASGTFPGSGCTGAKP